MQGTFLSYRSLNNNLLRKLGYVFIIPLVVTLLLVITFVATIVNYQNRHEDRIYSGISVGTVDVSMLNRDEAEQVLQDAFSYPTEVAFSLIDVSTERQWEITPAEFGLALEVDRTLEKALYIGRAGTLLERFQVIFNSYYYGYAISPVYSVDEGQLNETLKTIAEEIEAPAVNAQLNSNDVSLAYAPSKSGRRLDVDNLHDNILALLMNFSRAKIELPILEVTPQIQDEPEAVVKAQQMLLGGPLSFYFQEPLVATDLQDIVLAQDEIQDWVRAEIVQQENGNLSYNIFLDELAIRQWLEPLATEIYREPENARFYFDDNTKELVLVEPHVNGRELDVDATILQIKNQIGTSNRSVPIQIKPIIPTVNSQATSDSLGITELISERTTWFYGSSDARKRNIARSAANFYGIVIAPGEEFSYNKYLGDISEEDGYEEGLIIVGGQTIKGIGGGVCQVSTTIFQTVFFAGYPVTERWPHGYMLGYYNDGEGPGMDATVYSPLVDFKFINNTSYHLLIENYYNETDESLTFKFYSTSMGRTVEKSLPVFENIVNAPPVEDDVWTFDPDIEPGAVRQIDWATEGAKVTVGRTVYNASNEVILQEEYVSNYIAWPNGYLYGAGVEVPEYISAPSE